MINIYRILLRLIGVAPVADVIAQSKEIADLRNEISLIELALSENRTKTRMTEKENARIKAELEERRKQNIEAQKEYLRS